MGSINRYLLALGADSLCNCPFPTSAGRSKPRSAYALFINALRGLPDLVPSRIYRKSIQDLPNCRTFHAPRQRRLSAGVTLFLNLVPALCSIGLVGHADFLRRDIKQTRDRIKRHGLPAVRAQRTRQQLSACSLHARPLVIA
jgi:hypothetical protein